MTYPHLTDPQQRARSAQLFRLMRQHMHARQAQSRHETRLTLKDWYRCQTARHRAQLEGAREVLHMLHD